MKPKQNTDLDNPVYCREIYVKASAPLTCDGCGEPAIAKGQTYLRHVSPEGSSMNLCARCTFALKFRLASTNQPFEFGPGDLVFEKLPNRYQSAWMRHRQRFTKDIKSGMEPNEAWRKSCGKLLDELGMRHIYERDVMLAEQERKFSEERKKTVSDINAIKRRIKKVKENTEKAIERMAKARRRRGRKFNPREKKT